MSDDFSILNIFCSLQRCLTFGDSMEIYKTIFCFFAGTSRLIVFFMSVVRLISTVKVKFRAEREKFWFFIGVLISIIINLSFETISFFYGEDTGKGVWIICSLLFIDFLPSLGILVVNLIILNLLQRISMREKQIELQMLFSLVFLEGVSQENIKRRISNRTNGEIYKMLFLGLTFYLILFMPRALYWTLKFLDVEMPKDVVEVSIVLNSFCHVLVLVASSSDIRGAYVKLFTCTTCTTFYD